MTRNGVSTAHILVVDDDPDIAEPLVDYLSRREGYIVSVASGGEEAISIIDQAPATPAGPVDIVLLDMRMPDINGLDVLAWIRTQTELQFTRVLMLTASTGHDEKIRALSAGADDYITKPYQYQELLARVRTNLRSRELERQLQWQSEQLAALNGVARTLAGQLDTQEVLRVALDGVAAIFEVDLAAVFLLNSGGDMLTCWSTHGNNPDLEPDRFPPVPAGAGLLGQAFVLQGVCYFNGHDLPEQYQPATDAPPGYSVESMMACGLSIRPRAIGTLVAWNKRRGEFAEFDADLFHSLANSIGRAIENAWLFQRVRTRQQELLESRNRLQAVIDGILQPIYTVDDQWTLVAVNQSQADRLNEDPRRLVQKTCYKTLFDRDTPCDHCQVAELMRTAQPASWSVRWLGHDHLPQEWRVSAYSLPRAKGERAQSVVVWLDRTEERRLENSLMQASKLAAIGQLAAGVAHEINNPLTVINANAEMLKMVIPGDGEEFEMVDYIARAGQRATKVVRGLLNSARQEQYEFAQLDINTSIRQALDLVLYQLQSADIVVVEDLAGDLPPVWASNEHMKSVWINLLVNAADAVKEMDGERRVEVVTRLNQENDAVRILITDNGVGMSAAHQGHIFEPFYTTKDPDKGTGLGLATCYRIIEQHGGQIDVISAPGEGTTFIIILPVNQAQGAEQANHEPTTET